MDNNLPTLLIVDDERLNLNSLVELFQEDHNVFVAKNGYQALMCACPYRFVQPAQNRLRHQLWRSRFQWTEMAISWTIN